MAAQTAALACTRKPSLPFSQPPCVLENGLAQIAKRLHSVSRGGNITNSDLLRGDNRQMSSDCAPRIVIAGISKVTV